MRARLTVIILLLVVLPTAVLSLLAGRAFRAWELVLRDEVESAAARAIRTVWREMRAAIDDDLAGVQRALSESLARSGSYEDLSRAAVRMRDDRALVGDVYLFMHPWGMIYPQSTQGVDRLRPGWDFPPKSGIAADGDRATVLLAEALRSNIGAAGTRGEDLRFSVDGAPYCFARVDRMRDLYVGFRIDVGEFDRLLVRALAESSGGPFVLLSDARTVADNAPVAGDGWDVVVTDSFSRGAVLLASNGEGGSVEGRTGLATGGATVQSDISAVGAAMPASLAEAHLFAPFDGIKIIAVARDAEGLARMGALQARLYVWGVLVLAVGIIIGAGFVLREAVSEIRLARAKSDFAIGVSHDLRTPVASMKMLAESLYLEHVPDKDTQKEFLGTIVRECDRLSQLIERVLFLVRFGQDSLMYRPMEIDPGEVTRLAVEAFRARRTGRDVEMDVAPDLPKVKADRSALTQVVLNLLDNAAKYGMRGGGVGPLTPALSQGEREKDGPSSPPEGGEDRGEGGTSSIRVVVSCEWQGRGGTVKIAVSDRGPGMEKSELKRIFKPFYRGPGAVDSNTSGVGLGLAMCKRIVSEHGGRIEVQSEKGKGSTFTVSLPTA